MKVLVDCDGLPYLAGFAVERSHYWVVYEDAEGSMGEEYFTDSAVMKAFKKQEGIVVVDQERVAQVGPLEHALAIAKDKMERMHAMAKGDAFEAYIKGDGYTFRQDYATLDAYKGNRKDSHKPAHFDAICDYLIGRWGATKVNGREVDDEISIRAHQLGDYYWVCSPDKDLDQIPGWHWNYRENVEYHQSAEDARLWFWRQVLSGDFADNVKGCWKIGEAKADAWIEEHSDLEDATMWAFVVAKYQESTALPGCPYAGLDPAEVALENARLVYMQQAPGEIWNPPGIPFHYEEGNLDD